MAENPDAAAVESGARRGYSAPIVKIEDEKVEVAVARTTADSSKAEGEETVDYGGPEETKPPKAEPTRALPDYGDLDDGVEEQGRKREAKRDEKVIVEGGKPRIDAILVSGVQRLTRPHLEEVFASKDLPKFERLDWIGDEHVICVYRDSVEAAKALAGARGGFGHTIVEDTPPGPGLWRAQRGMLDFRIATENDQPEFGWKKMHRGGRQVREYRFWEAVKQLDSNILAEEDAIAPQKRGLESLISEERPQKRARVAASDADDDGGAIDLLEQMAQQDKQMMGVAHRDDDDWQVRGSGDNSRQRSSVWPSDIRYDWNEHDDRGAAWSGGSWNDRRKSSWRGADASREEEWKALKPKARKAWEEKQSDDYKRGEDTVELKEDKSVDPVPVDSQELARRSQRADRFKGVTAIKHEV